MRMVVRRALGAYCLPVYKCPYCKEQFSVHDIDKHFKLCRSRYREEYRKRCSQRVLSERSRNNGGDKNIE